MARYVNMLGQVVADPTEPSWKRDVLAFKLQDHNGLYFNCEADFQLAHHVRKGDRMLFYGQLIQENNNPATTYIKVLAIHELDPFQIETDFDTFELRGAL